jgi:hypothetical protein
MTQNRGTNSEVQKTAFVYCLLFYKPHPLLQRPKLSCQSLVSVVTGLQA